MINVAIVEDSDEFRNLWSEILNDTEGYSCVGTFDNVRDAVAQLPSLTADVVLMDINLPPDGNGIDCVRQLRSLCPTTQFLMFTIFQEDENIFEAMKAGATGYILKKTSPTKVFEAIEELHAGGAPMSPAIARRVLQSFHEKQLSQQVWSLQPDEKKILTLLSKGLQYKEIETMLKMSLPMVKLTIHSIYQKLEVSNRTEAVNKFLGHIT
jgi:DNA-binding NarL/FixJ family response regulator